MHIVLLYYRQHTSIFVFLPYHILSQLLNYTKRYTKHTLKSHSICPQATALRASSITKDLLVQERRHSLFYINTNISNPPPMDENAFNFAQRLGQIQKIYHTQHAMHDTSSPLPPQTHIEIISRPIRFQSINHWNASRSLLLGLSEYTASASQTGRKDHPIRKCIITAGMSVA